MAYLVEKIRDGLGPVKTVEENEVLSVGVRGKYNLVVIDASEVSGTLRLISAIESFHPESKVVVVNASPTWKQAREAFYAGAVHYIRKTCDKEEMVAEFKKALTKKKPFIH